MLHLLPPRPLVACFQGAGWAAETLFPNPGEARTAAGFLTLNGGRPAPENIEGNLFDVWRLLREVSWRADFLCADATVGRDCIPSPLILSALGNSDVHSLRRCPASALAAHAPSLLLALMLERLTFRGEGVLRLHPGDWSYLPTELRQHVWAIVQVGTQSSASPSSPSLLLFFARDHDGGVQQNSADTGTISRYHHRQGSRVESAGGSFHSPTLPLWRAAGEEWRRRASAKVRHRAHLSGGAIGFHLSAFDHAAHPDLDDATRPFRGLTVAQAVLQREPRERLQRLLADERMQPVDPALLAAIASALNALVEDGSPLMPLSHDMRLGWLDKADSITCHATWSPRLPGSGMNHDILFMPGTYPLRPAIKRCAWERVRVNLKGGEDTLRMEGDDLCFFVRDGVGREVCFSSYPPAEALACAWAPLDNLSEHFTIPPVPTLIERRREEFQHRLQQLSEILA